MVAFYVMQIQRGKMQLEDVPEKWRDEVESKMKER